VVIFNVSFFREEWNMSSRKEKAIAIIHTAAGACAVTAGAMAQGATVGADAPFLTGFKRGW